MLNNLPNNWHFFDPLALDTEEIVTQCMIDTAHAISIQQGKFRDLQRELRSWGSYGCLTSSDMMKVAREVHTIRTAMFKIENTMRKLEKDLKRYTGGN